jgi:hypothetical protein
MPVPPSRILLLAVLGCISVLLSCASAPGMIQATGQPTRFLTCEQNAFMMPGAAGLTVRMPAHELVVPVGGLPPDVRVRLVPYGGDTTGVRVITTPPATLVRGTIIIDARRCPAAELNAHAWSIWRRVEGQQTLVPIPTRRNGTRFIGEITGNSGFMIAM